MFGGSENNNFKNDRNIGKNLVQSPYLNIDPNYLSSNNEYILLDDDSPVRTRVQIMFAIVGTATITGALLGGLESIRYTGIPILSGKVSQMQATSNLLKNGGRLASKFGTIAFLYCTCSVICEKSRHTEDELNTVIGGGVAGALYSLPSVFNISKYNSQSTNKTTEELGFLRKHFMRFTPAWRFMACTSVGIFAGGLLSIYKNQASSYIKKITSRT